MNQDSRDAMDDIKKFRHKTFEELHHETEDGGEYWSARELYPVLEYSRKEKFEQVIERAILSCDNSGHRSEAHFHRAVKMAHIGLGKQKKTPELIPGFRCFIAGNGGGRGVHILRAGCRRNVQLFARNIQPPPRKACSSRSSGKNSAKAFTTLILSSAAPEGLFVSRSFSRRYCQ